MQIVQQPTYFKPYHTMSPIVAEFLNSSGQLDTTASYTVTLSGTGLEGTTSVAAVGGIATFSNVWSNASSAITLTASGPLGLTNSINTSSIAVTQNANWISSIQYFDGYNGEDPLPGLATDSSGNVYGVTSNDDGTGYFGDEAGTIYEIAAGTGTITPIASLDPLEASGPEGGLVIDSAGDLFGATSSGSIYEVTADTHAVSTLAYFDGTSYPLTIDSSGNLYGVTSGDGTNSAGTIFELPAGSSTINTLYSFTSGEVGPATGLSMDSAGNLYGQTQAGNLFELSASQNYNDIFGGSLTGPLVVTPSGTIYAASSAGTGCVLHFAPGSQTPDQTGTDIGGPPTALLLDSQGNLYGLTATGGVNGQGSLFERSAATGVFSTLVSFDGESGTDSPQSLVMDSNGNLWGVGSGSGGPYNYGADFEIELPDQAAFITPSSSITDHIATSLTVNLQTSGGTIDTSNQSPMTLSITSGPPGGTLGGTVSTTAVNGVANFSGVTFSSGGTYTLSAVSSDTPAETASITLKVLPSTVAWTGGGNDGSWSDPANWQGDAVPAPGDSVVFPSNSNNQPINLSSGVEVSNLTLNGSYTFNDNSGSSNASITLDGTITANSIGSVFNNELILTQDTTLDVGASDDLTLDSTTGSYNLTKTGLGTLVFASGGNLGSASFNTTVSSGTLEVDTQLGGSITVDTGATLDGSGTVGGIVGDGGSVALTADGSPAGLSSSGAVTLGSGNTLVEVLSSQSDGELSVSGPVNVSGATLSVSFLNGYTPSIGTSYTVISNQTSNGFIGTFNGLAQGALTSFGGNYFQISYTGGSGHSVILTAVSQPVASQLVFTQQPSMGTAGQSIGTVVVDVEDQYGELVSSDSNSTITLSGNTLSGTLTANTSGGVATFTSLSMAQSGYYTLTATASGLASANSSSIHITPAIASQLVFTSQPTNAIAGANIGTVRVSVEDQYGNVVTGDSSTVTLAATSLTGTLSANASNGIATFTELDMTFAGTRVLSAADGGLTPATSDSVTVTPAAASHLVITQQPSTGTAYQALGNIAVQVEDAFGNLVTSDSSIVTLTASDGTPLGGITSWSAVGGVAMFSNVSIAQFGIDVLSATDGSLLPATSSAITVAPSLASLNITAPATAVDQGTSLQLQVSGANPLGQSMTLSGVVWSLDNGSPGSIDQDGLFTAGDAIGTATVRATCEGQSATFAITINGTPIIAVSPYVQHMSPARNTATLHVQGQQAGNNANLIYTWSIISQPSVVSSGFHVGASPLAVFSVNGTNAAQDTSVTFLASGTYTFQVTASDGIQSVSSDVQVTATVKKSIAKTLALTTQVSGVSTISNPQEISGFVVTFNGPLDAATAEDVRGYRIARLTGGDAAIASATYDPSTYTVTLTLTKPMKVRDGTGVVRVLGTGKYAVRDALGHIIDGDSNGKAGGTFTYEFSTQVAKTIRYHTAAGDLVKLTLRGPGKIISLLPAGSSAPVISLSGTNPITSILTGKVHKGRHSLGDVVIDELNGTDNADIQLGDEFHVNQSD